MNAVIFVVWSICGYLNGVVLNDGFWWLLWWNFGGRGFLFLVFCLLGVLWFCVAWCFVVLILVFVSFPVGCLVD